jgi:hypothetical protein
MSPTITPFWFKQRQCKAEPVGEHMVKVSGPILAEAYLHIRPDGDHWVAGLRSSTDGPDVAVSEAAEPTEKSAWEAAFELYRINVIT